MIHWCNWAQQGDVHIACTDTWTEPSWGGNAITETPDVYRAIPDELYTFDKDKVTCPECRKKILDNSAGPR